MTITHQLQELTGVFARERWRPDSVDDDYVIASLECGTVVLGKAPRGELIPGLTYRLFGKWDESRRDPRTGKTEKQFRFQQFAKSEPHSRFGLVNYLRRYAPGIGPGIAGKLFDALGTDAVKILRTDPARAAAAINNGRVWLPLDKAQTAAEELKGLAATEDTKIELVNLFAGRGFPYQLPTTCIRKWGVLATRRILRDPFCLLVEDFGGCGFARCDRLYCDLGLPLHRTKRQMLCVWHAIREDNAGHTWHAIQQLRAVLGQKVSGVATNLARAVKLGVRSGWLAFYRDPAGQVWIADGEKAEAELKLSEKLRVMLRGPDELPRFSEALPGECDETDVARDEGRGARGEDEEDAKADPAVERPEIELLARLGRETGICQFCGRTLLKEESRRRGYGPICAAKHSLPWGDES